MPLSMEAASGNIFLRRPVSKALRETGFMPTRCSEEPSTAMTVAAPGCGSVTIRFAGPGSMISAPVTSLKVTGSASSGAGERARRKKAADRRSFKVIGHLHYS
ncbi:hypothetical protein D3C87_1931090 [compost metagenome]